MKTQSTQKWLVCRVCLGNPSEDEGILQDIFSQSAATRLDQMLHICADVPVSLGDNFPDKMCSKCVRCLRLAYKFRMTCQRSHQYITDIISNGEDTILQPADEALLNEEYSSETIVWDADVNDLSDHVKMEGRMVKVEENSQNNVVSYVINDDEDSVVFDEYVEDPDTNVVYDTSHTVVEEGEQYADYEELEVLAAEAAAEAPASPGLNIKQQIEYPDEDNDIANDVLSSDDETYSPVVRKPKSRMAATRARVVRKVAQPKGSIISVGHEKKRGRPRDKGSHYICDVCGNIYPTQARLTEHLKFHSGVKPHECEICGRGFVQNQQLVRHMNTHTGNRPYKCNFCPAAFADRSTKTKHHRIHTKERPYECDVCKKTFTYSDNLKFHKMIHTGEKPHVCDICGKGFVKAYKMRLHRVTHEKRNWKPVNTSGDDLMEDMSETAD